MAEVLRNLGVQRAWVFHGVGGLDEFSLLESTRVSEVSSGEIRTFIVTPEELGFRRTGLQELEGGDAAYNARLILRILQGDIRTAPREIVVLNAAVGLYVGGKASNIKTAARMAREAIDSGAALRLLQRFQEITHDGNRE